MNSFDEREKLHDELINIVGQMLLPMVSPYDLSKESLKNHYHNNPYFRNGVLSMIKLITSNPLTYEKVINDLKIMHDLNLK